MRKGLIDSKTICYYKTVSESLVRNYVTKVKYLYITNHVDYTPIFFKCVKVLSSDQRKRKGRNNFSMHPKKCVYIVN